MKYTHNQIALSVRALMAVGAVAASVNAHAFADATIEEGTDRIEILGSRIKRVDIEGASPVISIDRDSISRQGFTNASEVLASLSQSSGGSIGQQNTFGFTPSASGINLRGFGVGRSLILIDGRRVPQFPLASGGTTNFVDLASIPTAAIERIEVLTDGASAIYGSDAISGVINVVLRKDIDGSTVSMRRGLTQDGGGASKRVQLTAGSSDDNSSTAFFMEWYQRDALLMTDRERSESDLYAGQAGVGGYSSFGNTFVINNSTRIGSSFCDAGLGYVQLANGFCGFDRSLYRQIEAPLDRKSFQTNISRNINDDTEFFVKAGWVSTFVTSELEPTPYTSPTVAAGAANNPTTGTGNERAGQFQRRLHEFGPRSSETDSNSFSFVSGLKGVLADVYDWQLGFNYAEQKLTSVRGGYARIDLINARVNNGTLNLFNPIDAATVQALTVHPRTDGESTLRGVDFQLSGDLFELPAGPAQFAMVTEAYHQEFFDKRDVDTLNGNVVGLGGTSGFGEREYAALGMELLIPVVDGLNVNLAARYDKYFDDSNTDDAVSPKLSVEYRPTDALLLRASAGKSFRAPDMQRLFGAQTRAFTAVIDTPTCSAIPPVNPGDPRPGRGDPRFPVCYTPLQSVPVTTGSNIGLEEEKGESFNVGAVWQVTNDLTATLDMFSIKLEDIVNTPSFQNILDNPDDYPGSIQRVPANISSSNPTGLTLFAVATNMSYQKMEGVDLTLSYRVPTADIGDFSFRLGASYVSLFETKVSDSSPVVDELSDLTGRTTAAPEWKGNTSVTWTLGDFGSTLYVDYVGDYIPTLQTNQARIPSYVKVNLSGFYNLPWNAKIQLGVNNIADKEPPLFYVDGAAQQSPFYDQGYHDLLGRNYFVEYSQQF